MDEDDYDFLEGGSVYDFPNRYDDGVIKFDSEQYEESFSLLSPLAENGHLAALYYVGLMYFRGKGVEKNIQLGLDMLDSSSEAGYAQSINMLASLYSKGDGVQKDLKRSHDLYLDAAEQGYKQAQYKMATIYAHGIGVEKNQDEADKWNDKAKNNLYEDYGYDNQKLPYYNDKIEDHDYDTNMLSYFYSDDEGFYKHGGVYENGLEAHHNGNHDEAFTILKALADEGHGESQYLTGLMYYYGSGVTTNDSKAKLYLNKSAKQGNEHAEHFLNDDENFLDIDRDDSDEENNEHIEDGIRDLHPPPYRKNT